jgi:hypothetical protein
MWQTQLARRGHAHDLRVRRSQSTATQPCGGPTKPSAQRKRGVRSDDTATAEGTRGRRPPRCTRRRSPGRQKEKAAAHVTSARRNSASRSALRALAEVGGRKATEPIAGATIADRQSGAPTQPQLTWERVCAEATIVRCPLRLRSCGVDRRRCAGPAVGRARDRAKAQLGGAGDRAAAQCADR